MTSSGLTWRATIRASYIGYVTQAVVNNLSPLLFLTFRREFSLSLTAITMITTVNFAVQLAVDLASTFLADRIGYRRCAVAAHVFCAAGLTGMCWMPSAFPTPFSGLITAVVLYAVGGGLIEVLISPIVESCPTEGKEAAMSLLHSFYCWGHAGVVLLSTLYFNLFGIASWRFLAVLYSLIPLANAFLFSRVPLYPITGDRERIPLKKLVTARIFWVLMIMMAASGAAEQAMSQWSSAFAEAGLGADKTVGDLLGPCAFALFMGTSRALYGKRASRIPLTSLMAASAVLCILCYLGASLLPAPILPLLACALCGFSVGLFWPGTFSVAAAALPGGGTSLFALLALAGDLGCSGGPTLVGLCAGLTGDLRTALPAGILFPVLLLAMLFAVRRTGERG